MWPKKKINFTKKKKKKNPFFSREIEKHFFFSREIEIPNYIPGLENELKENVAQKEDQEERIATLEKRYLNSQREATTLRDLTDKLEQELKNKEDQTYMASEKLKLTNEKLDMSEQKLLEFASMPDIEDQLKDRMEALQQAQERQGIADSIIRFEIRIKTRFELKFQLKFNFYAQNGRNIKIITEFELDSNSSST